MQEEAGQDGNFMPSELYSVIDSVGSRKQSVIVYPDGKAPTNPAWKQSDISLTSKSSKVIDYGLGDRLQTNIQRIDAESQTEAPDTKFWQLDGPSSSRPDQVELDPTESYTCSDTMETMIHKATRPAEQGPHVREWLSLSDLLRICQSKNVLRELETYWPPEKARSYTDYICPSSDDYTKEAKRVLCILILIRDIKKLPDFIKAGLKDKHLPFLWTETPSGRRLYTQSPEYNEEPLDCFGRNGIANMKLFYEKQWQVFVPFIARLKDDEVHEYQLHGNTIMPWTSFPRKGIESGYSDVCRVQIHDAHHNFNAHKAFALKTLRQHDPIRAAEEFESELRVFMKMERQKHLLELCATFKTNIKDDHHEYSFLFPWAEGRNLADLWKKQPRSMVPGRTIPASLCLKWLAEQCHGIASALLSIHDLRQQALKKTGLEELKREEDEEYYGIHGDIKPENILYFSQMVTESETGLGILKIADFGLTQFHTLRNRTRTIGGQSRGPPDPAPTYKAPELAIPEERRSRKADIWSLGCVFSQFITWAIHGESGVIDFDKLRTQERDIDQNGNDHKFQTDAFFKVDHRPGAKAKTLLKKSAKDWLDGLTKGIKTGGKPNFLTDFLNLTRHRMLESQRQERIGCEEVVQELGKFVSRSKNNLANDQYWNPLLSTFTRRLSTTVVASIEELEEEAKKEAEEETEIELNEGKIVPDLESNRVSFRVVSFGSMTNAV